MSIYELIVRKLKYDKCRKGYIWCTDGSSISPSMYRSSGKEAYGYVLTDNVMVSLKRSYQTYTWTDTKSYCTRCNNSRCGGYCPDIDELELLYNSIMYGDMKTNLIESGLYERCNYRTASAIGWGWIWSRSEYDHDHKFAYFVDYDRNTYVYGKSNRKYAVPFFKF